MGKIIKGTLIILAITFLYKGYSWLYFKKYNTDEYMIPPKEWSCSDKALIEVDRINEARKDYHRRWIDSEIKHNFILAGVFFVIFLFIQISNNNKFSIR